MTIRPETSVFSAGPADLAGTLPSAWRTTTLVELLHRRAAEGAHRIAYTFLEDGETRARSITFGDLETGARAVGRTLARFAKPGARAILLFEDGLDTITGLFGCWSAGLVAVSGIHPSAPRSIERLRGIIHDSAATVVLGHASVLAEFQRALDEDLDDLDLRWVASDKIRSVPGDGWVPTPGGNETLALIQYTSGSTREPRGVTLTHRNLMHNLHGQAKLFGYRVGDTGVSWLPFSHDMGLIGCVLIVVYGGGRCVLLAPSHFLEDPMRWLRAMSRYKASLSGGPNFAYDLCARRAEATGVDGLDLSGWTIAVSGAEPIRADVMRRFATVLAPAGLRAEAIQPSYGLAEATLLVAAGDPHAPLHTRIVDKASLQRNLVRPLGPTAPLSEGHELVGCGRSLPDQAVAIVDPVAIRALPPGEIGEIWVAGPSVSAGYFNRPADNAEFFQGDLKDGRGPYFRTGDLGFILDDELFITGRLRDLLVIRGKNYYPQDIEHTAEASHPALRPACSAAFLDRETGGLVVVAELLRQHQDEAAAAGSAIREAIVREHGVSPGRVVLAAWGTVLKTPSGKIQRAQTRDAEAAGQLSIVHQSIIAEARVTRAAMSLDNPEVEDWILARLHAMGLDPATLDPGMRLAELGFDSLKIVELKAELERDLGIVVHVADLYAFEDVRSLADYLRSEVQRNQHPGCATARPSNTAVTRSPNRLAEQRQRRQAVTGGAASSHDPVIPSHRTSPHA